MSRIKFCFDKTQYHAKPDGSEIAQISNRLANQVQESRKRDLLPFLRCVGAKGQSFCPATFTNGHRRKENFEQMRLFALDFDGKIPITIDEVIDRTQKYDIPMLAAYETFSSTNRNKFRILFLNDTSITDVRVAEIILHALHTVFPEADKKCSSVVQMYFGGKNLLEFDKSIPEINIDSLIRNMTIYLQDRHGQSNFRRPLHRFAQDNSIALTKKKLLDISVLNGGTESLGASRCDKISPNTIIVRSPVGENLSSHQYRINLDVPDSDSTRSSSVQPGGEVSPRKNHDEERSSFFVHLRKRCKLFNEFETGHRIMSHPELFGLGNTMIQIETGIARFMDILEKNSYFDGRSWKYDKWRKDLTYNKVQCYKPTRCKSFCPYTDKCTHGSNPLTTAKPKQGAMERIAGYEEKYYPISEVEADLNNAILSALDADDAKMHIIKAQTALGKTRAYLKLMENSSEKWLIVVPTNILKDDVFKRAVKMGIEVLKTPSLHDEEIRSNMPDDVKKQIDYLLTYRLFVWRNAFTSARHPMRETLRVIPLFF